MDSELTVARLATDWIVNVSIHDDHQFFHL